MKKSFEILVVEDDDSIRDALEELLHSEGYQLLLAENGERALKILEGRSRVPDLILLDLSMPIMDGATFLKEMVQRFPKLIKIPVITMTAAGPADIPEGLLRKNVLRKPLDVDVLMECIEAIVQQK